MARARRLVDLVARRRREGDGARRRPGGVQPDSSWSPHAVALTERRRALTASCARSPSKHAAHVRAAAMCRRPAGPAGRRRPSADRARDVRDGAMRLRPPGARHRQSSATLPPIRGLVSPDGRRTRRSTRSARLADCRLDRPPSPRRAVPWWSAAGCSGSRWRGLAVRGLETGRRGRRAPAGAPGRPTAGGAGRGPRAAGHLGLHRRPRGPARRRRAACWTTAGRSTPTWWSSPPAVRPAPLAGAAAPGCSCAGAWWSTTGSPRSPTTGSHAIGDCAEHQGAPPAWSPPAWEQAGVLAEAHRRGPAPATAASRS